MNIKNKIFLLPPKLVARVIAFILATVVALLCVRIGLSIDKGRDLDKDNKNADTAADFVETNTSFSREDVVPIGAVVGAYGATVCSLSDSKIIAEKSFDTPVNTADAVTLLSAILTSKAISEGRIGLGDEAVCPASAAKSPSYNLSSHILPIGRRMAVSDILKCMLFQSGSAYAITLAVHISGSEEAFTKEINSYLASLEIESVALDCSGDAESSFTPYQLSVIIQQLYNDPLLCSIIKSGEPIVIKHGSGVETVVRNDFFESVCTPSQAQNDGIIGGRMGKNGFGFVIFLKEEKVYLVTVMQSASAFSDILMLYSAYVLS